MSNRSTGDAISVATSVVATRIASGGAGQTTFSRFWEAIHGSLPRLAVMTQIGVMPGVRRLAPPDRSTGVTLSPRYVTGSIFRGHQVMRKRNRGVSGELGQGMSVYGRRQVGKISDHRRDATWHRLYLLKRLFYKAGNRCHRAYLPRPQYYLWGHLASISPFACAPARVGTIPYRFPNGDRCRPTEAVTPWVRASCPD